MEKYTMFMDWKNQYGENEYTTQSNLSMNLSIESIRFNAIPWKRLLNVPWTERGSNESILKEINPEYSLEGLMLKLQYFCHLMWRANSLEKILMLGKIEGRRGRGWQRMKWLDGITSAMGMSLSKLQETVKDGKPSVLQSVGLQGVRYYLETEQQLLSQRMFS